MTGRLCAFCGAKVMCDDSFCSAQCCRAFHGIDANERPDKVTNSGTGVRNSISNLGRREKATQRWMQRKTA